MPRLRPPNIRLSPCTIVSVFSLTGLWIDLDEISEIVNKGEENVKDDDLENWQLTSAVVILLKIRGPGEY